MSAGPSGNHTAALKWVVLALASELANHVRPVELLKRGNAMVAIAEANDVPIEAVIEWIHRRTPGKEWSAAEFRSYAHAIADTLQAVARIQGVPWICGSCGAVFEEREKLNQHLCRRAAR
jgi:hypothetical protein